MEAFVSNAESLLLFSYSQVLVKLLKAKETSSELNNILIDIYYFRSVMEAFVSNAESLLLFSYSQVLVK
ncbi:unnamed protein product [Eruca vesicaria subsp. sativa]|uniref:Uncharacterized protein n=1 Tax=Eruca vesicaria subsp. sativa TaxID=29727 RepID=A0ABC8JR77_ERUVS|nr:unnamed protein product [Eruca vesicaria subsp. sativa]